MQQRRSHLRSATISRRNWDHYETLVSVSSQQATTPQSNAIFAEAGEWGLRAQAVQGSESLTLAQNGLAA